MKSRWRLLGTAVTFFAMVVLLTACRSVSPESENDGPGSGQQAGMGQADTTQTDMVQADSEKQSEERGITVDGGKGNLSGTVPDELEYIPSEYKSPAE